MNLCFQFLVVRAPCVARGRWNCLVPCQLSASMTELTFGLLLSGRLSSAYVRCCHFRSSPNRPPLRASTAFSTRAPTRSKPSEWNDCVSLLSLSSAIGRPCSSAFGPSCSRSARCSSPASRRRVRRPRRRSRPACRTGGDDFHPILAIPLAQRARDAAGVATVASSWLATIGIDATPSRASSTAASDRGTSRNVR